MLRLRKDGILFPEGKKKAFTLSYDDGTYQDERFLSMLKSRELGCTFNLNTSLMGDMDHLSQPGIECDHFKFGKDKIMDLYEGFEIAVHTHTHPDLVSLGESTVVYEIITNRKELEDLIHRPVRGMAYPMGTHSKAVEEAARGCGIAYSRTTKATHTFDLPEDFLCWNPSCHHTEDCLMPLTEEFLQSDPLINAPAKLFYIWGHSYEFDAFDGWERMEAFLDRIAGHEEVWYATNIELYDYITAYRNLIYSATGDFIENRSCMDVWIQIDGKSYRIPSGKWISCKYKSYIK